MSEPEQEITLEDWEERLKRYLADNGLRLTRQRRVIAEAFFECGGHPNIEQLYERVRETDPGIGQATVYRTLKLLVESGLANQSRFGGGVTRYEADTGDHHDHIICTRCGLIVEFHNEEIEALQERIARSFGFSLMRHRHEMYGLCPKARGIKNGSCPAEEAREAEDK